MLRFNNIRIGGRLIAGFAAMCVILVAAVAYTLFAITDVGRTVDRMVTLRTPVAVKSTQIVGNVYSTLAALRGYLLTGNPQGKVDRAAMWNELDATSAEIDKMADRLTDAENKHKWSSAKALLGEFRIAQDTAEAIAFTPDAFPATKILIAEASPRVAAMFADITKMINEEGGLAATPERKRLLKTMADVRGNLAGSTAQLRMYLLSGDKADKESFNQPWKNFQNALAILNSEKSLLTPSQKIAFENISKVFGEFASLPDKMIATRESAKWNMPVHILTTEAVPRALRLLDLLDGVKGGDGTRSGGIKTNEQLNLAAESQEVLGGMSFLTKTQWILLIIGLGLAVVITFFTTRSIANPIRALIHVLQQLEKGNTSIEVPGAERGDEIGTLARAVVVIRANRDADIANSRIRAALDSCQTNVMVADENYNITYMNNTMLEMIRAAESDMRKDVPTLDTSKLIGTNIDTFHKNPSHQRRILDALTSMIETDLKIGGRDFHLIVTPIFKPETRQRVGTIVEWKDETAAKAAEQIATRVRSALDNCKTNVMVADENYNIVYTNNTMMTMLRSNEAALRKDVPTLDTQKLIGTNIDVFHKNPAHQRRILDTLTTTIETDIKVAGCSFHLVVTPIFDKSNRRLGTAVEWRDETIEKAIEAELDRIVNAAVAGDFTNSVSLEGKQGFMLNLAKLMNSLCENVATAMDDFVAMVSGLAGGDFTRRITADYQGAFGKLKSDANAMAEQISSTIGEIKASAREVTNASAEISTSTTDLSQRTEEQAASLEETSASMEEISSTVKKNAENAQEANQSAGGTREVADRGGKVVAQAVEAMARIEDSSRKISDIIGVIDEIARQTNLLALNAAVEAARAGEAGRGFAVVASEVRSLAQRSSQAAKDIKDLITNSNSQVKDGVELVNRAGTALNEIVESIKKVAEIVSDIASASAEQASGIEQVNKALAQMDEVTQQNSALVEENAATAKTLEHQAKMMDERVSFFRIDGADEVGESARASVTALKRSAPAAPAPKAAAASKQSAAHGPAAAKRGSVGRMQTALATAFQDDPEWKEF